MARAINRLSARQVATLTAKGYHADGGGLYLRIEGTKTWVFRYRRNKRLREMGLGPLDTVTLAMAREAATEARRALLQGVDPIDQRRAQVAAGASVPTFQAAAEEYITQHKAGWKNAKHAEQWANSLSTYVYPRIGTTPIDRVDTPDLLAILKPIWTDKTETATRVRQRIEAVLASDRARRNDDRANPARWRGHLAKLLPKPRDVTPVEHFPALAYEDLPAFMADLRQQSGEAARALEFTILTAVRTEVTIGAVPRELEENDWVIPKERMKRRRPHIVPLVAASKSLVKGRKGTSLFFNALTGEPLSNNAMRALLQRMGHGDITVHGFRSTFKTWATEKTEFPDEVSEMALAHEIKDKTKASYQRGPILERRRKLMREWAKFCGY